MRKYTRLTQEGVCETPVTWTKSQRNVVIAAYLGWTLDAFDFFLMVFMFKDISADLHSTAQRVSTAVFLTLAMRPVGAFLFGRLADRFGRKPALMWNIVAYSLLEMASGFAPTMTTLLIVRALFGVAMGGEWGIGSALTMETIPPAARGAVSGLLQVGYPSGFFLASLAVYLLYDRLGWRYMPVLGARNAVDLGCGPGNSTEVLAGRFPNARIGGIDSSEDMIAAARKRLPAVDFEVAEIGAWIQGNAGEEFDVILANAVLHWVPEHAALFHALLSRLAAGGSLAVQMPDNLAEPAQILMREIAADGPWRRKLAAASEVRVPLHSADWYYRLLHSSGARVDVWRTTYYHPLVDENAIVEWFKGSGLRPFLDPLDAGERSAYLARYTAAVRAAYAPLPDGSVLLPFPRLFIVATR